MHLADHDDQERQRRREPWGPAIIAEELRAAIARGHDPRINNHLSALRHGEGGGDADGCVPVLLQLHRLWRDPAAQARRLLRVLLLWFGAMPANPSTAFGRAGRDCLPC